jgi:hypothetical protein
VKIKTPENIASLRRQYERSLEDLDDAEQIWSELTREQQITEIFHYTFCTGKHGTYYASDENYCRFEEENWTDTSLYTKNKFKTKVDGIVRAVPVDGITDEQLGVLFTAIKKAVEK